MCVTCGCLEPANDHGDPGNLTVKRLRRAAATAGLPLAEAAWNIPRTLAADADGEVLDTRPVLVWDVDGILAFTAEALTGALNSMFGATYSPLSQSFFPGTLITARLPVEQAAWVSGLFREAPFLATFAPDFHAIDVLCDAFDAGYECRVVTERHPLMRDITVEWLASWGVPASVTVEAVGHGNKPPVLIDAYGPDNPAVLLDDNPAVQLSVARPGIEVWTPDRPYTPTLGRENVREFESWRQARYWLGLGPPP